ncbi:hypothetical protein EDC04DRAFT_2566131 [Pisolithus marmoratus]|nr:hypothetical protein EDC04DRAFT_2566131 [Pisolithus marmoratus]
MQNDYIHEWLPRKKDFLQILLELEAPPVPWICKICQKDGVYRCLDCMHQPLLCTNCCCMMHETHPFHRIQQWTGDFFKDSALHMTGLQLHLGHGRVPCPSASANEWAPFTLPSMDDGEWEDVENIPLHLRPPVGSKYLTIVDVTGVHFVLVQACQCSNADSYHMQLFQAKLCPSTLERPSTAFTFSVLDDFLRDNVERGTSGMNYYSKLHWVTSNVFPHLVVDRYQELLWVVWQWHILKLLKWSGFQDNKSSIKKGNLAIFCVACPQPGINVSPTSNLDQRNPIWLIFHSWKYTRTVVMDGNFKAEHMHERWPTDQVWLMDRCSFMVTNPPYQAYLKVTPHITEKSPCNNHKAISHANASCGKLNSMGVGATACAQHGCFYPHSVVDFQKGERQLNMDCSLAHALSYNMAGINNILCFYDINCAYMKNLWITAGIGLWHIHSHKKECYLRYSLLFIKGSGWTTLTIFTANSLSQKLKTARASAVLAREVFERFKKAVTPAQKTGWSKQEEAALLHHIDDPSVMDIFEIQLKKAPTVHAIELQLLQKSTQQGIHHGAMSWITRGLAIEEGEIILKINEKDGSSSKSEYKRLAIACHSDKLATEHANFTMDGRIYMSMDDELGQHDVSDGQPNMTSDGDTLDDDEIFSNSGDSNSSVDEVCGRDTFNGPTSSCLPLPSHFGIDHCKAQKVHALAKMELELHIGQANDALHGLHLALADKAVVFKGVVRPTKNYLMRTQAWQMIHSIDSSMKQYAMIYRQCQLAMITLGAGSDMLGHYQDLHKSQLSTSTATFTQGAHDHCGSQLPWFWTLDILKDTDSYSWLTEFYHIHWLHAKAVQDRWEEEEELLTSEFQWVMNYFKHRAKMWKEIYTDNKLAGNHGVACYAARQQAVYDRLAEQGELAWQGMNQNNVTFDD